MKSPKEHYDSFLAEKYAWMLGDWKKKEEEQFTLFQTWGVRPDGNGIAWDLGAGNGLQSLALERLGFQVLAVDFSRDLLSEIVEREPDTRIRTLVSDIRDKNLYVGTPPELLICMGDTLTHLESASEVELLIRTWSDFLSGGNRLILAYRDLSYGTPGEKIGFNVRSEPDRIFSCILEFGRETTNVTDLFQEKSGDEWKLSLSSYNKLNLPIDRLLSFLEKNGFLVERREELQGMKILICKKS